MAAISVYFARLTVNEEGRYLDTNSAFVEQFMNEARNVPPVRTVLEIVQDRYKVDLLRLIREPYDPSIFFSGRHLQAAVYVAIARFLEAISEDNITSIGFYSAGAGPAYIFADVFSLECYFEKIIPFQMEVRKAMIDVGNRLLLAEVLLEGQPDEDLESFAARFIGEKNLEDRVFFKDKRRPFMVHLAGYGEDVRSIRDAVWRAFPSSRKSGMKLPSILGAHLGLYERSAIDELLSNVDFRPPRFRIVGIQGEEEPQGSQDQDRLRQIYSDASQGFMDTGSAFDAMSRVARQIVVVGTQFGSKSLKRLEKAGAPGAILAEEPIGHTARHAATRTSAI